MKRRWREVGALRNGETTSRNDLPQTRSFWRSFWEVETTSRNDLPRTRSFLRSFLEVETTSRNDLPRTRSSWRSFLEVETTSPNDIRPRLTQNELVLVDPRSYVVLRPDTRGGFFLPETRSFVEIVLGSGNDLAKRPLGTRSFPEVVWEVETTSRNDLPETRSF